MNKPKDIVCVVSARTRSYMRKKLQLFSTAVLLACFAMILMTGCSVGAPTVNLNDYVTVEGDGWNGYGKINASIDYDQLIEDYSDRLSTNLDTQYFGDKTADLAVEFVFNYYDPYVLAYDCPDDLSNGDTIQFSWNTSDKGIDMLKKVLNVNFKYEDFTYTVDVLEELTEIDLFENYMPNGYGISGNGSLWSGSYVNLEYITNASVYTIPVLGDAFERNDLSNGDIIHVYLDENDYDEEYLAKYQGIKLVRTEADIVLNCFSDYAYDNPYDVLEYLSDDDIANATNAVSNHTGVNNVQYIGSLYYYMDKGEENSGSKYNKINQLVLIFYIDNGTTSGYTYIAPNNDMVIGYYKNGDGEKVKTTLSDAEKLLEISSMYYKTEKAKGYTTHKTIDSCIAAFESNVSVANKYTHLIASDSLNDYIAQR